MGPRGGGGGRARALWSTWGCLGALREVHSAAGALLEGVERCGDVWRGGGGARHSGSTWLGTGCSWATGHRRVRDRSLVSTFSSLILSKHFWRCGCTFIGFRTSDRMASSSSLDKK